MANADEDTFYFDNGLLGLIEQKKNVEVAEIFHHSSCPVNEVDGSGNTLLHYAAKFCNDDLVKHLINSGYKINPQNCKGQTPLWLAIQSYGRYNCEDLNRKTIVHLLDANADMHIRDTEKMSPLRHVLASHNGTDLLFLLFQKLTEECLGNSELIAEKLIAANTTVFAALYLENAEVTSILLNRGCFLDPPYDIGYLGTALQASIYFNSVENVRVLLDHGADPNAGNERHSTPMMTYALKEHEDQDPEVLKLLLERGANPTMILAPGYMLQGYMQMIHVFRSCGSESIRMLLRFNVDLNARDEYGSTAIHYVVQNRHLRDFDEFDGMEFDANVRCNQGMTPLLLASSEHSHVRLSLKMLKFLLRHGADPNVQDNDGMTCLMQLCRLDVPPLRHGDVIIYKRVIECLLLHGADPQIVAFNGDTVFNDEARHRRVYPVESVIAHLAMIAETGTPIKRKIRRQIKVNEKYEYAFQVCRQQLRKMKKIQVWKSMTLHELFFGEEIKIRRHMRDRGFRLRLNLLSNKYTPFPYYCYVLREKISKIFYSYMLIDKALAAITLLIGIDCRGYRVIFDNILNYLTGEDLMNLCRIK